MIDRGNGNVVAVGLSTELGEEHEADVQIAPTRPARTATLTALIVVLAGCSSPSPPQSSDAFEENAASEENTVSPSDAPAESSPNTPTTEPIESAEPGLDPIIDDPQEEPDPQETACEAISAKAEVVTRPIDIVLVIDNSSSMVEEIEAVESNLNDNFANLLEERDLDYRVLVFSNYDNGLRDGSKEGDAAEFGVCIGPPLGPSECADRTLDDSPHNLDQFVHFVQRVGSTDAWCLLRDTMNSKPRKTVAEETFFIDIAVSNDPLLVDGWTQFLRSEAFKHFLSIGDDSLFCEEFRPLSKASDDPGIAQAQNVAVAEANAAAFDQWLLTYGAEHFGNLEERNYIWHSIVGIEAKADMNMAYEPSEPMVSDVCSTAMAVAYPHQALSRLTGGLRYPVCNTDNYDAVFQRVAQDVVRGAQLPCQWEIPTPPEGRTFNINKVNVRYTPGDGSPQVEYSNVPTSNDCADDAAWFYDDPVAPTRIFACPAACQVLNADLTGQVDVAFGCDTRVIIR